MKRVFLIPETNSDMQWLQEYLGREDRVVCLGQTPFVHLRNALPSVCLLEDLVPYSEIRRLALQADQINGAFASEGCGGALFHGYDWPRVCRTLQDYFFRDILLAEALADVLKREGLERVIWVGRVTREPTHFLPTSNVVASTFRACLKDRFEVLSPSMHGERRFLDCYRGKFENGIRLLKKKVIFSRGQDTLRCDVIAVFPPSDEWQRYTDALVDLHREYGERFQLWSLGQISGSMAVWAKKEGAKVVWIPYPDSVGPEARAFFNLHWNRWKEGRKHFAEQVGCPALASDELESHFHYVFMKIWPRVAEYARILEKYLAEARPRWLVGSTNPIVPQFLPYHVATRLGIRSIALPHGSVQMGHSLIGSSLLACRTPFERAHFVRSFPEEDRVLYCGDAVNNLSYQINSRKQINDGQKRTVAVLTCDPTTYGSFMPMADRGVFIQAFFRLADLAKTQRDITFVIKSHPRWDLSALFQAIPFPSNVTVLDPKASVVDLVERAWVVVMFNHFGSAVVHAIEAEKPVLFLHSAGVFWPHTEWLAFPAGEVVQDVPGIVNLLVRLKDSPEFYQHLQEKCRRFRLEYLQASTDTLPRRIRALEESGDRIVREPAVQPALSV